MGCGGSTESWSSFCASFLLLPHKEDILAMELLVS
jgi:hypothetical protein